MIDRAVIDEIINRTDIDSLVSSYVSLQRAGSLMRGLCPFHSERSPSFTVYPSDNSFYCFGCGAGGNAITFVKRAENLDFEDAVEFLAKRVGITVTRTEDENERRYDRSKLLAMNKDAAKFFHASLYENNEGARQALEYLTKKRRLSGAIIKHFGLGYAPSGFGFINYMKSKGYTEEELTLGFLATRSDKNNSIFSSFRNRVMFPIIDPAGNVIAFGGRVMDDSLPKYKNSSDTPVFKKSKNLFALNYARHHCAETLILCEGYMDVIALHAAGIPNAVATLGTAITPEQARLMSRYTKKVIISYDSDEAGQKAATKAMALLEGVGLEVKVLKMSGAKDPDEYIKTFGVESFRSILTESRTKFDFNMEKVLSKHDISIPQEKIVACAELCLIISQVYSSAEREIYIKELSKKLEIDEKSIKSDVERNVARIKKATKQKEKQKVHQSAAGYMDRVNPDFVRAPSLARSEEAALGMLMLYPECRKKAFEDSSLLSENDFFTAFGKRVFTFIKDNTDNGFYDDKRLDEIFTPEEVGRITKMKVSRMSLQNNGVNVFLDIVKTLKDSVDDKKSEESVSTLEDISELINRKRAMEQMKNPTKSEDNV